MDKNRIQIIITSFLAIIMIFVWINTIKNIRKKISTNKANVQAYKDTLPALVSPASNKKTDKVDAWVRDPFSGKLYTSVRKQGNTPKTLSLAGIIWDKNKPAALINDKVVGVGDRVGGSTVVSIKNDRVLLNDGTNDFEIKIGQ